MDRELLREQCESYLLGLLEGSERAELQALLDGRDPACLEAMREAREFVASITLDAPEVEPPALLRSKLLNAVRSERAAVTPAPVKMRRAWSAAVGWAVAAGLAAVAFFGARESDVLKRELSAARSALTELRGEVELQRKVLAVVMSRDARSIRLVTTAPDAPQFRAYWSGPAGLVLTGTNIPRPAAGRTMQLWVVPKQGNPISAGLVEPDAEGRVVMVASGVGASPEAAAALAISDEPAGGSAQPTTKPAWVGGVTD